MKPFFIFSVVMFTAFTAQAEAAMPTITYSNLVIGEESGDAYGMTVQLPAQHKDGIVPAIITYGLCCDTFGPFTVKAAITANTISIPINNKKFPAQRTSYGEFVGTINDKEIVGDFTCPGKSKDFECTHDVWHLVRKP